MRRIFPPVVLLGLTLAFGKGVTAPITPSVAHIPRLTGAIYPQEWEGIWTFQDSAYSCTGTFLGTQTSPPETVCTGEDYAGSPCSAKIGSQTRDVRLDEEWLAFARLRRALDERDPRDAQRRFVFNGDHVQRRVLGGCVPESARMLSAKQPCHSHRTGSGELLRGHAYQAQDMGRDQSDLSVSRTGAIPGGEA